MGWYKKTIKTAAKKNTDFGDPESDFLAEDQIGTSGTVFDVQRYVCDYYVTRIAISKTDKKISVTVVINNGMLGNTAWQQYWFYDLDEMKKARKTYNDVVDAAQKVVTLFVKEEIPSSLFWTYIKKNVLDIDPEASQRLNVPVLNYYKRYMKDEVLDWRNSIYGNRYPKYSEESEKQYKEKNK
jgi:hypothetical protein